MELYEKGLGQWFSISQDDQHGYKNVIQMSEIIFFTFVVSLSQG